jgi:hypothetical protein
MNPGSEGRRALLATALGAVLGLIAVLFVRRDRTKRDSPKEGAGWRGRSAT